MTSVHFLVGTKILATTSTPALSYHKNPIQWQTAALPLRVKLLKCETNHVLVCAEVENVWNTTSTPFHHIVLSNRDNLKIRKMFVIFAGYEFSFAVSYLLPCSSVALFA